MRGTQFVDVLICGAGPSGLAIGVGLGKCAVNTIVIEKRERAVQERLGRACTLYPRTMELLETIDVVDEMLQVGFHGRSYAAFREGQRVQRAAWQNFFPTCDQSFHNYILNIRQSRSEDIFAAEYIRLNEGQGVRYGWRLVDVKVEELGDGHNVTAQIAHDGQGSQIIRCKYLVGADGGSSTIRELFGINMQGNDTDYRWVRIDGKFTTNLPNPDLVFAALETQSHGNVLWAKVDGDAHRIGFALTRKLQEKYPNGITQEEAIAEAAEAMKPFSFRVERLDWWTQYNINQKVAERFQVMNHILLAGDAAHTHSSAFAQGMNTGIHDATNLIWKLAGTIKGWYTDLVLPTYHSERHAAVSQVVATDRMAAEVVSGGIPDGFAKMGLSNKDALASIMGQNLKLTTGLGVSYGHSTIVSEAMAATSQLSGTRSPDVLLRLPATMAPIRLYEVLNRGSRRGAWSILVFTGQAHLTKPRILALKEALYRPGTLLATRPDSVQLAVFCIGTVNSPWEVFDGPPVGRVYYDIDVTAHDRYSIYPSQGGIVVVRPDHIVAFAAGLDEFDLVEGFFKPVFATT